MSQFITWFLSFCKDTIVMLFALLSPDNFSFGYMMLGIAVVGAVISATIGAVAVVSNAMSRRRD